MRCRRLLILLLLCATAALAPAGALWAQGRQLPDRTTTQWQPFIEYELRDRSVAGNPFDVEAKAVFTHAETGEPITTGMFYDGGDHWKFRFTGIETGEYEIRTYSEDPDLAGWRGTVRVVPNADPGARGFMSSQGFKWTWSATGQPFIPQYVMAKDPGAYVAPDGSANRSLVEADAREFVEEHGFTGFHIQHNGHWFEGENPDPRVYRATEALIRAAHERGGASHIWFWGSHQSREEALPDGPMSDKDRRNLRYFAARMGAIPGWSMGYGFDTENGWASRAELDAWKAFLEKHMGWDHFLGARVGWDEKGLFGIRPRPPRPPHDVGYRSRISDEHVTWLGGDYLGYTSYRPLFPRYYEALYHHPERPSFEEDRFRLRDRPEWTYKDYDQEMTRRGLWHSALAGGVANIWGNLLPQPDRGGSQPYPNKEHIKTYSRFFENRFLRDMLPEYVGPELVLATPDSLPGSGTHAVVYREDTDRVRLDLRNMRGSQPVIAVDAKAPYREIDVGTLPPEEHVWKAPYVSDWALAVGRYE